MLFSPTWLAEDILHDAMFEYRLQLGAEACHCLAIVTVACNSQRQQQSTHVRVVNVAFCRHDEGSKDRWPSNDGSNA